ncbi:hypothetical protein HS088_TW05G00488 [Tripterygium wilfordii]|uniref:Dof zinc finger protein n=1 Tax=Tripterygium wilfordii TaxID=458696 RepID=A0A7J7DN44_TRIWF|nr:dof zinc finger protein DOF3.5-like [Tripterygium wilfordii]KAF5747761.1 hypothetical protein HS088_TW05G00488 [Tripterygium wilfordii]
MERGWKWKSNVDHQTSPNCPRCCSSNTKFCYYNNYSLTQPRYFCKDCRRYWTKGGSLRNVPVGGGCRKNRRGKSAAALRLSTCSENPRVHNSYGNSMVESVNAAALSDGSHIDLALVYANFLNQPQPEPKSLDSTIQIPDGNIDTQLDQQHSRVQEFMSNESVSIDHGLPPLPGEELVGSDQEIFWSNSQTMASHSLPATAQEPILGAEGQDSYLFFSNWSSFDLSSDDTYSRI